jgi:hypothetical protein
VLGGFKVLAVVVLKIQVFWDITPCQLIGTDILKDHTGLIFRVMQSLGLA